MFNPWSQARILSTFEGEIHSYHETQHPKIDEMITDKPRPGNKGTGTTTTL
jgi:hypothetical protein